MDLEYVSSQKEESPIDLKNVSKQNNDDQVMSIEEDFVSLDEFELEDV